MIISHQAKRFTLLANDLLKEASDVSIAESLVLPFPLSPIERKKLITFKEVSDETRTSLTGRGVKLSISEALRLVKVIAAALNAKGSEEERSIRLLSIQKILHAVHSDHLVTVWEKIAKKRKPTSYVYQFRIKLIGIKPEIWRRIVVRDCTLDKFHEHIQCVMGWANSHLHDFEIRGKRYGDPDLIVENFSEMNYRDSTITLLSSVLPEDHQRFRFRYNYDFGDSWKHEVVFEGSPKKEPRKKYPICIEGERACPPDDVGGPHGYADFLRIISDKQNRERVRTLEWAQGWFDPDEFDAAVATKSMWKGIFDWRNEE